MKEAINMQWLSDMAFEADVDGHKIYIDSTAEHGGKNLGARPKTLMLVALAGRITSYNVCYTKLLRCSITAPFNSNPA